MIDNYPIGTIIEAGAAYIALDDIIGAIAAIRVGLDEDDDHYASELLGTFEDQLAELGRRILP